MDNQQNDELTVDQPVEDDSKFFFVATGDDQGLQELRFRKDGRLLMGTIFSILSVINESFDQPFETLGDFLRDMAEKADQIEVLLNDQRRSQEDGQPAAN